MTDPCNLAIIDIGVGAAPQTDRVELTLCELERAGLTSRRGPQIEPSLDVGVPPVRTREKIMLKDKSSAAIVPTKDIKRARKFYEQTLGLDLVSDEMGGEVLEFRTGDTTLTVYQSDYAGTNQANAVVWAVGEELESIASDLKKKGVKFEQYDMEGASFAEGVYRIGDFRMVWFKDPDGNILHLNSAS
jgi:catechol 2,3-dioxygenase-like lactoylglutathione lyase family enzyme